MVANDQETPAWNNGWRMGVFDKCNGRAKKSFDNCEDSEYNRDYIEAYDMGFESQEIRL